MIAGSIGRGMECNRGTGSSVLGPKRGKESKLEKGEKFKIIPTIKKPTNISTGRDRRTGFQRMREWASQGGMSRVNISLIGTHGSETKRQEREREKSKKKRKKESQQRHKCNLPDQALDRRREMDGLADIVVFDDRRFKNHDRSGAEWNGMAFRKGECLVGLMDPQWATYASWPHGASTCQDRSRSGNRLGPVGGSGAKETQWKQ